MWIVETTLRRNRVWRYDICRFVFRYNIVASTPEDKVFFKNLGFKYVVFDEAHMLKNMSSKRYTNLMKLRVRRLILSPRTYSGIRHRQCCSLIRLVLFRNRFVTKSEGLARVSQGLANEYYHSMTDLRAIATNFKCLFRIQFVTS